MVISWAVWRMFECLPVLGIKLVMNSIGQLGMGIAVQQKDAISECLL